MNTLSLRSITRKCLMGCALLSFVLGLAIMPGRAAFAATVTCGTWSVVSSPNPSTHFNTLQGVAAISARDAWAVGDESGSTTGSIDQTLTEHWDGTSWNVVASPNPSSQSYLKAVTAVSAKNVWAVGAYQDSSGNDLTLIEHWDGASWSVVPSPNPSSFFSILNGVTAISAKNVWAVGYYNDSGNHTLALIEHWNGMSWSAMPSPVVGPGSAHLYSVAAISASNVWVVGDYWPGTNIEEQSLTERWTGKSWQVVTSPDVANSTVSFLTGVTRVPGSKTLWAVGGYVSGNLSEPLLEYWNGTSWSIVSSPIGGSMNRSLYSLVAISANNVWAVGDSIGSGANGSLTLTEQWNGTSWSIVSSPNVGPGSSSFYSVTQVPHTRKLWTVGISSVSTGNQTLTASYCS